MMACSRRMMGAAAAASSTTTAGTAVTAARFGSRAAVRSGVALERAAIAAPPAWRLQPACRLYSQQTGSSGGFGSHSSPPQPPSSFSAPPPSSSVYVRLNDFSVDQPSFFARVRHAFSRYFAARMRGIFIIIGITGGIYAISWYTGNPIKADDLFSSLKPNVSSENRFPPERPKTRMTDVVGCDEAKAEVMEVIEYLKDPSRFNRLGGKMPKGVLLLGPPGTGKTLLARAIAGEAGVPFFAATGGDFEEMWVGVGAKRVRELFEAARKVKPSIIFIDEIDTVGGKRNDFDNPKTRMSLNQLLTEMDGFSAESAQGIIVIAATNFADKLDAALLRPGRFDRHVTVSAPDIKGRKAILDLYAKKIKLDPTVDLDSIARGTPGLTGADLFHLLNSASLRASTLNKPLVTLIDLEYAKDKILMGAERTTAVNSLDIRRRVAVYESGKSLTAMLTPAADPVHKVTVIQRGSELGKTQQQRGSNDDHVSNTYTEYLAKLDVLVAGRAAEQLVYGTDGITTAATGDLNRATQVAREMVMAYGYGDVAGLASHARTDFTQQASNATKLDIDHEVQQLLANSYARVLGNLTHHKDALDRVSAALLEHEVLDGEQIKTLLAGGELPPPIPKVNPGAK